MQQYTVHSHAKYTVDFTCKVNSTLHMQQYTVHFTCKVHSTLQMQQYTVHFTCKSTQYTSHATVHSTLHMQST